MTRKRPERSNFSFSGALSKGSEWLLDGEEDAIDYYESIRQLNDQDYSDFVYTIADNTDFSYDEIDNMLQHLCFNSYPLADGRYERFDEDPYIMYSLQRLYNNNFYDFDIVLVQHENMEYSLVQQGYTPADAHEITQQEYDYYSALLEAEQRGINVLES